MAGKRQPTALVVAKGKKHLTKAEIKDRENRELIAAADNIAPPSWLKAPQKKRFNALAAELLKMGIFANVDCEALARLVVAEQQYIEITAELDKQPITNKRKIPRKPTPDDDPDKIVDGYIWDTVLIVNQERNDLLIQQDRAWKQCRQGAADFGLSVAQRCRIVAPTAKEAAKTNKFEKFRKEKAPEE